LIKLRTKTVLSEEKVQKLNTLKTTSSFVRSLLPFLSYSELSREHALTKRILSYIQYECMKTTKINW